MKKIIVSIIALAMVVGIGVRIWYVNEKKPPLPVKEYAMNEPVMLEKGDTFLEPYERMAGYEITALSAELATYDELVKRHNYIETPETMYFDEAFPPPENLYMVHVKIKNTNKEILDELDDPYIELINYHVTGLDYYLYFSSEVFAICNPKVGAVDGFRIMPQTEMEFDLPFVFHGGLPVEEVVGKELRLAVSKFPVTRNIMVRVDETPQKEGI